MSQNGKESSPKFGVNIKNIWKHQPENYNTFRPSLFQNQPACGSHCEGQDFELPNVVRARFLLGATGDWWGSERVESFNVGRKIGRLGGGNNPIETY